MIEIPTPTIGRIVLFRGGDGVIRPAIITVIHGVQCVDLYAFPRYASDPNSGTFTSVTHADPIAEPHSTRSWHWMPYQLGQAAKTAEVQAAAAAAASPRVRGFKLGSKVRDTVTGFTGIAISETTYLNGCVRYGVQPPMDKDGKMPDCGFLDQHQLEPIEGGIVPVVSNTGGPQRGEPTNQPSSRIAG